MNRRSRAFRIIAVAIIVVFVFWRVRTSSRVGFASWGAKTHGLSAGSNLQEAVHSAVASSEAFVKSRVTGGVGAMLMMDDTARLPKVAQLLRGSPAESAGLRPGDLIIKVGDWATAGQPLAQVVEEIRGFTLGRVTVTIQRPGSTNVTLVMPRSSWNTLGMTNMFSAPASSPTIRLATNGTNWPTR